MFTGDQPTVTFQDVAGVDEAKEELNEIVEFLQEPEKFISLGARIPKGGFTRRGTGYWQDSYGKGGLWRSRSTILFYFRF